MNTFSAILAITAPVSWLMMTSASLAGDSYTWQADDGNKAVIFGGMTASSAKYRICYTAGEAAHVTIRLEKHDVDSDPPDNKPHHVIFSDVYGFDLELGSCTIVVPDGFRLSIKDDGATGHSNGTFSVLD